MKLINIVLLTKDTEDIILELEAKNNKEQLKPLVNYIVSPRFVPSTTAELMKNLGNLSEKYNLPIQSHLDENRDEIAWVESLHPEVNSFCEVYEHYGLLRNNQPIMAHCIYNKQEEIELLKKYNIMVAHCAQSNFNLSSGIMPLRYYLNENISVGIGSDVGAGHTLDMRKHIILIRVIVTVRIPDINSVLCRFQQNAIISRIHVAINAMVK